MDNNSNLTLRLNMDELLNWPASIFTQPFPLFFATTQTVPYLWDSYNRSLLLQPMPWVTHQRTTPAMSAGKESIPFPLSKIAVFLKEILLHVRLWKSWHRMLMWWTYTYILTWTHHVQCHEKSCIHLHQSLTLRDLIEISKMTMQLMNPPKIEISKKK